MEAHSPEGSVGKSRKQRPLGTDASQGVCVSGTSKSLFPPSSSIQEGFLHPFGSRDSRPKTGQRWSAHRGVEGRDRCTRSSEGPAGTMLAPLWPPRVLQPPSPDGSNGAAHRRHRNGERPHPFKIWPRRLGRLCTAEAALRPT